MTPLRVAAVILIVGGLLGLVYGSSTHTSDSHDPDPGVTEGSIQDRDTVNVPAWAGIGAIVVGAGLLFVRGRSSPRRRRGRGTRAS